IAVAILAFLGWYLVSNTARNLDGMQVQTGFDFLGQRAGFDIGETVFSYMSSDTYFRAFLVGVGNTLRVALAGIVLATVLGTLVGIGRLSKNFLLRKLCDTYVETLRNIPLLIQLLATYLIITELLPSAHDAFHPLPQTYLSKSGLRLPVPVWSAGRICAVAGRATGVACALLVRRAARGRQERAGQAPRSGRRGALWLVALPVIGWRRGGAPSEFDVPEGTVFNISGGVSLTPECLA